MQIALKTFQTEENVQCYGKEGISFINVHILVWLQIPVYNSIIMQILQGQDRLSEVHPGHIDWERTHVFH